MKITPTVTFLKKTNKFYDILQLQKTHKYFRTLHRLLYCQDGKKEYTRKMLNMLTPQGIALWYMDDGCSKVCCNTGGKITSCSTVICTYCTEQEANIIHDYFLETWGIEFKLAYHSTFKKYSVRANTANSKKFRKLIEQYIIPSMEYKIATIPT